MATQIQVLDRVFEVNLRTLTMLLDPRNGCVLGILTLIRLQKINRGASVNIKSMNDFNNICLNCNLMDLNFCCPRYTWKNGRVQERLNWVLANFKWFTNFKEAHIQHLNWFKSDHRPVLLKMNREVLEKKPTSHFQFMATWVTDDSFKELLKRNWDNKHNWPDVIAKQTDRIKEWNIEVFSNINKRKRELTNKLSGIDRANPRGTNPFLNHLQETLWKDYEKTLMQEELLWCQKARHRWLHFGDRNTKFFHASTLVKKKMNKVETLRNEVGNWVTEEEEIKAMISKFLKNLYSKDDQVVIDPYPLRGIFHKLDSHKLSSIEAEITSEEIKDAIFSMGALKAPGPDGFHAMFYQS